MKSSKILYFLNIFLLINLITSRFGESAEGGRLRDELPILDMSLENIDFNYDPNNSQFDIEESALKFLYGKTPNPFNDYCLFIKEAINCTTFIYQHCDSNKKELMIKDVDKLKDYARKFLLVGKKEYMDLEVENLFLHFLCELNIKKLKEQSEKDSKKRRETVNILMEIHHNLTAYNDFWRKNMSKIRRDFTNESSFSNFTPKELEYLWVSLYKVMLLKYITSRLSTLEMFKSLLEKQEGLIKFMIAGNFNPIEKKHIEDSIADEYEKFKRRSDKNKIKSTINIKTEEEESNSSFKSLKKSSELETSDHLTEASSLETEIPGSCSASYLSSVLEILPIIDNNEDSILFLNFALESMETLEDPDNSLDTENKTETSLPFPSKDKNQESPLSFDLTSKCESKENLSEQHESSLEILDEEKKSETSTTASLSEFLKIPISLSKGQPKLEYGETSCSIEGSVCAENLDIEGESSSIEILATKSGESSINLDEENSSFSFLESSKASSASNLNLEGDSKS
ncbi:hypothetical protein PGAL8A_00268300 [Plasmodium gallinaceum]|uniref:Plasmodium RESA N-terminal domain-containing protein n=1 Tax=Plasmodium gallinaceum TaxID=5849 RepID=A0A1J1GSN3_PLAGA|nr:hypothetical protein PGAL8A_00268300 [Plasmodium gallinaceum]CRG95481.1 hypothetical protein PGAL8A_00268300 [Plasmodium gallinaceum]